MAQISYHGASRGPSAVAELLVEIFERTENRQTNRQTNRHTDTLIAILRTVTVSEVRILFFTADYNTIKVTSVFSLTFLAAVLLT